MAVTQPVSASEDPAIALTTEFLSATRALITAGRIQDTLTQVTATAVATIEGCDFAGIFLAEAGVVTTLVQTDPAVAEVDALQHHAGEGPCLDAITQSAALYAGDLAIDPRWPGFGPQAAARGMRSVLALPLTVNGTRPALGALNLYARYPRAFGVIDRGRGVLLAALTARILTMARTRQDDERRAANLHAALATREMIGQAQGILMERERITADQAFDILRRASQHLNRKLREIAQDLIETGESPDTGDTPVTHPRTSPHPSP